jgi:hypothetical protein
MHAVVGHVTIDPNRLDEAEKQLHGMVVPMVSQTKGFVSGTWSHNDATGKGVSIAMFESEEDARALVTQMQAIGTPSDSPVALDSVEVYRVVATA